MRCVGRVFIREAVINLDRLQKPEHDEAEADEREQQLPEAGENLPPISEPRPGVANWFTKKQFRAAAGLSGFPPENVYIRVTNCQHAQRRGDQQADAAHAEAHDIEETDENDEAENVKPMFVDHLPTRGPTWTRNPFFGQ